MRLFAMAGLAEAAMAEDLFVGWCGLLLLGIVVLIGWVRRSFATAMTAVGLACLLALMFAPWEAFRTVESDDHDVHYWASAFRTLSLWLAFGAFAAIASLVRSLQEGTCIGPPRNTAGG